MCTSGRSQGGGISEMGCGAVRPAMHAFDVRKYVQATELGRACRLLLLVLMTCCADWCRVKCVNAAPANKSGWLGHRRWTCRRQAPKVRAVTKIAGAVTPHLANRQNVERNMYNN